VNALGKLEAAALAQHAPALVAKLEDTDPGVREAAGKIVNRNSALVVVLGALFSF
jgi:hypothetical protein